VSDLQEWLADIEHWRNERRVRIGYDGSEYDRPELKWTQSSFIQPQMMVEERYFYDPVARRYTVDRYLDDLDQRYGGIDSVLIWHPYPNLGIDNRNQFDLPATLATFCTFCTFDAPIRSACAWCLRFEFTRLSAKRERVSPL
jgi:hypothetical protein